MYIVFSFFVFLIHYFDCFLFFLYCFFPVWCLAGPLGLGTFALTTGFVLQSYDWFTQICFVLSIIGTLKLGKKKKWPPLAKRVWRL